MANSHAKLMYPGLSGFYESMLPIAETFVRIVVGVMFLMHVSGKLTAGPAAVAGTMAKSGLEPAIMWTYVIIFLELVGGVCLIIGLFTRFFAAALAIDCCPSVEGLCGFHWRLRICAADRGGMLSHRHPRRRPLFR
jgi:putative oxidoreductase